MTSVAAPICYGCKHLKNRVLMTCDAYPAGIPRSILSNEADHRLRQIGDRGVVFDPLTFADAQYASAVLDVEEAPE